MLAMIYREQIERDVEALYNRRNRFYQLRAESEGLEASLSLSDLLDNVRRFDYCCPYCQRPLHNVERLCFEHIDNTAAHYKFNVVISCLSCNVSKSNRDTIDFLLYADVDPLWFYDRLFGFEGGYKRRIEQEQELELEFDMGEALNELADKLDTGRHPDIIVSTLTQRGARQVNDLTS